MEKSNLKSKYFIITLLVLVLLGAGIILTQNLGQYLQGDFTRVFNNPAVTTVERTTTSMQAPDATELQLTRMEAQLNSITSTLQAQTTKIDDLTSKLTSLQRKVNIYAEELASIAILDCLGTDYSTCQTSYRRIAIESQT